MSNNEGIFERVIIRTVSPEGWQIDFELKTGQQPKAAIDWLESKGYEPAPAAGTAVDTNAIYTFPASQMTATIDDGKAYWKVKGGDFLKFGIFVWPEALEQSGFNLEELNPMRPYDLTGWTAHYSIKKNGSPKKVVLLSRDG
jgi:hypothetical protein